MAHRKLRLFASLMAGASLLWAMPEASAQSTDTGQPSARSRAPGEPGWITLFNGRDLTNWTVKIRHHPAGQNFAETFRVDNGLLSVAYDGYTAFDEQFGHLFHDTPYSHYRLRVEYRFIGEQAPGAPDWAIRNSGAMLHAQPPDTMPPEQDFPISVEFQFLGGLGDGNERPTGSMCSPGTNVEIGGETAATHCVSSTSPTIDGDGWVMAEALVLGSELIVHFIDGEPVIVYGGITTGGGVVSGHRPDMKPEGAPLSSGYIALQSEGHPIQFRRVELLDLRGCMDTLAANYSPQYLVAAPDECRYESTDQ